MVIRTAAVRTGYSNKHHNRPTVMEGSNTTVRIGYDRKERNDVLDAGPSVFFTNDMRF